jgi:GT2 family glycosyltransferase
MKLSIVILCWNDMKVIPDCLKSIYATTHSTQFEVIVSDNGSTDGSIEFIRRHYPQVQVIENGRNLRFAKANNVGIRASRGEYVLILNPDTIIHTDALDTIVMYADKHPEAGAFGCRVLNADGSYQEPARPFDCLRSEWIIAVYMRWLGRFFDWARADTYEGWAGETERQVDWITGCFMLVRREVLLQIQGFDEQFFYYYEDMDLCKRVWDAGYPIVYTPEATITHLKGQSTNQRLPPVTFALDSQITRYRYYYKYQGERGVREARRIALVSLVLRRFAYAIAQRAKPTEARQKRLEQMRLLFEWNYRVDPVRLIIHGEEPDLNIGSARVLER